MISLAAPPLKFIHMNATHAALDGLSILKQIFKGAMGATTKGGSGQDPCCQQISADGIYDLPHDVVNKGQGGLAFNISMSWGYFVTFCIIFYVTIFSMMKKLVDVTVLLLSLFLRVVVT